MVLNKDFRSCTKNVYDLNTFYPFINMTLIRDDTPNMLKPSICKVQPIRREVEIS